MKCRIMILAGAVLFAAILPAAARERGSCFLAEMPDASAVHRYDLLLADEIEPARLKLDIAVKGDRASVTGFENVKITVRRTFTPMEVFNLWTRYVNGQSVMLLQTMRAEPACDKGAVHIGDLQMFVFQDLAANPPVRDPEEWQWMTPQNIEYLMRRALDEKPVTIKMRVKRASVEPIGTYDEKSREDSARAVGQGLPHRLEFLDVYVNDVKIVHGR